MSGLRVLITNYTVATRTGTETYVRDLALGLASRGHTPLVYTPEPGELAAELANGGIEVRNSLAGFVAAPDIVHGHHTIPTLLFGQIHRLVRATNHLIQGQHMFRIEARQAQTDSHLDRHLVKLNGMLGHRPAYAFGDVDALIRR